MQDPLNLFYSYSHADKDHRKELEKHLTLLVRNKIINPWYDGKITAGSLWENEIQENLKKTDIVIFLVTPNWLSSQACLDEWDEALALQKKQPNKVLIPIIATDCAWRDLVEMPKKLVLPSDGKPVTQWKPKDSAWLNVYEGIKKAAERVKKNFCITNDFKKSIATIEFCSTNSNEITLEDIFVFPNLIRYSNKKNSIEEHIENLEKLTYPTHQFIHGDSQSGKTKLCAWMYLETYRQKKPIIYIDLSQI
ncbi:toll/interleukin-1 receptor domain-containing protein, partial [Parendozoicomonas sp. Alg238-R29]|uniref:toll/interleukin-1 receptor domain-containing protein n=1 Tax=Parendozoicomonas sp. Alg238-R29 TaxID=2993446 RepID=UPI00248E2E34